MDELDNKNTVETDDVVESEDGQQIVEQPNSTTAKPAETKNNQSYVKIREEKAREKLLKELGVKDIEEAKTKLANADKALEKVEAIEKKLEAQETERTNSKKVKLLTEILDNEKVFDSDALINYIDLDEVELDANGRISSEDSKEIISQLKQLKQIILVKSSLNLTFIRKTTVNKKILLMIIKKIMKQVITKQ